MEPPQDFGNVALAGVTAVGIWMLYYRINIGPFCPAMWGGTAPPVVIAMAFFPSLQIIRRLRGRDR